MCLWPSGYLNTPGGGRDPEAGKSPAIKTPKWEFQKSAGGGAGTGASCFVSAFLKGPACQHSGQHAHFCQHLCQHPHQHFSGIPILGSCTRSSGSQIGLSIPGFKWGCAKACSDFLFPLQPHPPQPDKPPRCPTPEGLISVHFGSVWLRSGPFGSVSGPFRGVGWGRGGVRERGFCKGKEYH